MGKKLDLKTRFIRESYKINDDASVRFNLIDSITKSQGIDWTSDLGSVFGFGVLKKTKDYKYIALTQKGFGPDFCFIFFDDNKKVVKILRLKDVSHDEFEKILAKMIREDKVTWMETVLWNEMA